MALISFVLAYYIYLWLYYCNYSQAICVGGGGTGLLTPSAVLIQGRQYGQRLQTHGCLPVTLSVSMQ